MDLNEKINNLKRKAFIDLKKEFFISIFGKGFIDIALMQEFSNSEINTVISFIENPKITKNNYRVLPSMIINSERSVTEIDKNITSIIDDFFESRVVHYLFSSIYDSDYEISGYVIVEKESFIQNFNKLPITSGFIKNIDNTKFVYYCLSQSSEKIYIYKGLIKEEKFIKIVN